MPSSQSNDAMEKSDKKADANYDYEQVAGNAASFTTVSENVIETEYEIKLNKSDVVLPGGIYFLRMIAGERSYLKKFVVND